MQQRIVWIHGIGAHQPGYSADWQRSFNRYLNLQPADYIEVCWNTVFNQAVSVTRSADGGEAVALTPAEEIAEQQVREELIAILQSRAELVRAEPAATTRGAVEPIEYDELAGAATRGAFDWLLKPGEYLGDFTKYLVSRAIRTAVKEKAKEQLRPLAASGARISIASHSWGTVVAYESLLDLEIEMPGLRVANLFTLGSPLWLVRAMLDDRSGRKPGHLDTWINIHARGDLVGSWLKPVFRVDSDYAVASVAGIGPHSSYFAEDNEAVLRTIMAQHVLSGT